MHEPSPSSPSKSEPTLGRLLERAAASPKGVRFIDRHEDATYLSYADLLKRARQVSGGLQARGVAPGDRVAIILPTCPEFYDAFFGVSLTGAVPVPLYPPVRLGRLDEYRTQTADLLRDCRARLVLSDARTSRVIGRPVAAASPDLGLADVRELRGTGGFTARVRHHDVALIQHSSGTTGRPRPVRLAHRAVLANLEAIRDRILAAYPEVDDVEHAAVSWLPLYHDMGLIGCVLTSVAHPADLTLIPPELFVARPSVWLRVISRYRATVSGAPNFAYSYCAERIEPDTSAGLDLSAWRVALTGAEPVARSALDRFGERFRPHGFRPEALTPVYGLAEATLAVTFADPAAPFRSRRFDAGALAREGLAREAADAAPPVELVSLGRPLGGVRLRIAAAGGGDVEDGVLGHVEVGGASLFDGYDDETRRTANPEAARWFDTGDTGFLLDGELYLYGRTKDVIILRGRKYAPQQVEQALDGLEGARRGCAAAIGLPLDDTGEERLVVLLERARGASPSSDGELAATARARVTERTGLVPGRVEVLEPGTLPRTSSGKIRRAEARSRYRAGRLREPGGSGMLRLAMEVVRSRIALSRLPAAPSVTSDAQSPSDA
ncbi:MAG TPA: AMP-binding protein [Gemmatimonadota bacterium]|nr:AMP-binding protein [Gemmatimonadota bacterium]